jgi:hypothetical protein
MWVVEYNNTLHANFKHNNYDIYNKVKQFHKCHVSHISISYSTISYISKFSFQTNITSQFLRVWSDWKVSSRIGGKLQKGGEGRLLASSKGDCIHHRGQKGIYPCISLHVTRTFHFYNSALSSALQLLSSISDRCLWLQISLLGRFCLLEKDMYVMSFSKQPLPWWELGKGFLLHLFL